MTESRTFYPHSTDWDGVDPASGDIRQAVAAVPPAGIGSSCDFGTSGAKTITVDPYTAGRTTTGLTSALGWAINIAGADGMGGAADAHRFIPAGVWLFQGTIAAAPAVAVAACVVGINVYRVAAAPSTTRTLLFADSVSVPGTAVAGSNWTRTTGAQAEIELAAGETIQVTYTLACTGQIGGLTIDFHTGPTAGLNTNLITVPTPGVRTVFIEDIATTAVGTATVTDGVKTLSGVVYDAAGIPAPGATVKLFRQSDDLLISQRTVDEAGAYTFTRGDDDTDQWWIAGFSDATHHGTTDRDLLAT